MNISKLLSKLQAGQIITDDYGSSVQNADKSHRAFQKFFKHVYVHLYYLHVYETCIVGSIYLFCFVYKQIRAY